MNYFVYFSITLSDIVIFSICSQMSMHNSIIQKEISVVTLSGYTWISIDEIVLLRASGKETQVCLIDGKIIKAHCMLKWFDEHLPIGKFVRCHRSFIINKGLSESFTGNYIQMRNGYKVPRGRKFRNEQLSESLI